MRRTNASRGRIGPGKREITNRVADNSSREALVVFLHILKSAGSTVNSILTHHFSPDSVYFINTKQYSPMEASKYYRRERLLAALGASASAIPSPAVRRLRAALKGGKVRAVSGHFDLSLVARVLPDDARFVTLLRDPVERAVSHYYYYRRLETSEIHALAMRSTLSEWVSSRGLTEMDNGQVRRLAGATNLPCGKVTRELLESAKQNLSRFAVVGLTERFDEFQILLHRTFNWPLYRYPSKNVGSERARRHELDAETIATIERCNGYDMELYHFAEQLFLKSASRYDMAAELELLREAPAYISA